MPKASFVAIANKKYLPGLHVMLHSVRRLGLLEDFDFLLVTTDESLKKDLLVRESCTDVIVIDETELDRLSKIPDSGVKEHLRLKEIAKYNFIKFYAFRDLGYDFNILIDVDMIILKRFYPDEICVEGIDISASPRFSTELYPEDISSESSQDLAHQNLLNFWKWFAINVKDFGINSGFTVVGRGAQSDETYAELIALAASMEAGGDQSVIWRYIKQGKATFEPISPTYNFNQHALTHLSPFRQIEWLAEAKILHYPGSYPWDSEHETKNRRISHAIWHNAHREVGRRMKNLKQKFPDRP